MFCVPIIARNTDEALEKMARANDLADVMEIRLDLMDTFDLHQIIQGARKPVLVTYRSQKEGGKGSANPELQTHYIMAAMKEGADLVDVELSLPRACRERILGSRGKSRGIISTHMNEGTPSKEALEKLFLDCIATGADIVKIVTMAKTWEDNLRVLDLIPKAHDLSVKIIAFCMGPMGRISRVFSHLMGAHLTFTPLEAGQESASGQIPIAEMKKILEHLSL